MLGEGRFSGVRIAGDSKSRNISVVTCGREGGCKVRYGCCACPINGGTIRRTCTNTGFCSYSGIVMVAGAAFAHSTVRLTRGLSMRL